jgi:hypothetical protein
MVLVRQLGGSLPARSAGQDRVLALRFIGGGTGFAAFDQAPQGVSAEAFELILETRGPFLRAPTHAVWAEWRLDGTADVSAFRARAEGLFETRRQNIESFVLDWLLKSVDDENLLLVIGLYTSEEGARNLSRGHPAVATFAAANPAPYAHNESGLSFFEVLEASLDRLTL